MTDDKPKKPRGFATWDKEKLREVSAKGGAKAPPELRTFSRDPIVQRDAASAGGRAKGSKPKNTF